MKTKRTRLYPFLLIGLFLIALLSFYFPILLTSRGDDMQLKSQENGYSVIWVTKPNITERIARSIAELRQRPYCEYALLGWDENNNLFFNEKCGMKQTHTKIYNLEKTNLSSTFQRTDNLTEVVKDIPQRAQFPPNGNRAFDTVIKSYTFAPDNKTLAVLDYYFFGTDDIYILKPL